MAITTQDRFFGEGISVAGEADPRRAFEQQRQYLRKKRLEDVIGVSAQLPPSDIASKFEAIALAVEKADDQAFGDNAAFCKQHGIDRFPEVK